MDIVQEVLHREQQALAKFKPISVDKHLAVENDLGLLLCVDPNDLDEQKLKCDFRPKVLSAIDFNLATSFVLGLTGRST